MSADASGGPAGVATVTVVVPTRDRPGPLAACLDALEAQSWPDLEIIVVDDGSIDAAAVAAAVARSPRARLVVGEGRGPAAARNAGARAAVAPIVAFTDDDCRPEPGWVLALARRFAAGAEVVAGPTRNARPSDPWATASQAVTNHLTEESLDPVTGTVRFAPTSNLACRAELHRTVRFDERYPLAAGEDRAWCAAVLATGTTVVYEPAAVVRHHQDLSARRFWRQQRRYGRGAYRFHTGTGPGRPAPLGFYLRLLRRGLRDGGPVGLALVLLAQVATATGLLAESRSTP